MGFQVCRIHISDVKFSDQGHIKIKMAVLRHLEN